MTSITTGALAAGSIFGATLLGLVLRKLLPEHHLSEQSKDTVKLGVGMVATLSALVLGLLVNSAKNTYDTINSGFVQSGARVVQLDQLLAQYGPEAAESRIKLKQVVAQGIHMIWPEEEGGVLDVTAAQHANLIGHVQEQIRQLQPKTEAQKLLLAKAEELGTELSRTRWLMIEQSQSALPAPLVVVVISWLSMLYLSFALFAPRNWTVITILFLCALAVSLAIFMTMEMNRPLTGIVKVSSAPMRAALESLGK